MMILTVIYFQSHPLEEFTPIDQECSVRPEEEELTWIRQQTNADVRYYNLVIEKMVAMGGLEPPTPAL